VNIKILMSGPLRRRELSQDERQATLVAMTDDVARLVLKDNYDQTLTLSESERSAPTRSRGGEPVHARVGKERRAGSRRGIPSIG
jgi:glutamate dehydrogenase